MKYGIRVREIMSSKIVRTKPSESIVKVAKMMKVKKVGAIGVFEDKILVGIVTDGDIIKKVIALGKNASKVKVGEVMTKNPITVGLNDDLYNVSKIMNKKNIKRVFVKEGNQIIGYLSERDLMRTEPGLLDVLIEKLRIKQPSYRLKYQRS